MSLSKIKFEFISGILLADINQCNEIKVDNYGVLNTFSFSGYDEEQTYNNTRVNNTRGNRIEIGKYGIRKITIEANGYKIEHDISGEDKYLLKSIEKALNIKRYDIENIRFKKVFPRYDDTEERNEKLADLLDNDRTIIYRFIHWIKKLA